MVQKKKIIIKISGGSLKVKDDIFDYSQIMNIVKQIKTLQKDYNVSIVIGGGNIFRGIYAKKFSINRNAADTIGMLATTMNALMLQNILEAECIEAKVFNSYEITNVCDAFEYKKVIEQLNKGVVCIFSGGTGSSYFTTDTGVALRAAQIGADYILMGKNGVDGVYDKDPNKYKDAKKFKYLNYDTILDLNLQVMDKTALTMCSENNIKIIVFNIDKQNSIIDIMNDNFLGTIISN